jgi:hypothetical protein
LKDTNCNPEQMLIQLRVLQGHNVQGKVMSNDTRSNYHYIIITWR